MDVIVLNICSSDKSGGEGNAVVRWFGEANLIIGPPMW